MQDWLNRIGLTLQFFALFFVTPEIIGSKRVDELIRTLWTKPLIRLRSMALGFKILGAGFLSAAVIALLIEVYPLATPQFWETTDYGGVIPYIIVATIVPLLFWIALFVGACVLVAKGLGKLIDWVIKVPKSALPIGAGLFTVGFILLLWATFVHADVSTS
jgi:hypothetical protein